MALHLINFNGSIVDHQLAFFTKFTQLAVYREAAADPADPLKMIGSNYAVLRTQPHDGGIIDLQYVEIWGTKDSMNIVGTEYTGKAAPTKLNKKDVIFNMDDGCLFWAFGKPGNDTPYLIVGTGDFRNIAGTMPGLKQPELIYIPIPTDKQNSMVITCPGDYKIHIEYN